MAPQPYFQALMNEVLCPSLHKFVLVFFDNILICGMNREEHIDHLDLVLLTLKKHLLFGNKKNVKLLYKERLVLPPTSSICHSYTLA